MTSEEFVDRVKIVVRDAAAAGELTILQRPPGRRPPADLLERSAWYNSLEDDQKRILSSILIDVADRAVFGFLCVLDGARTIEDGPDKGHLELRYVKHGVTLLNPPEGDPLHELW
jgi:hypothetical protein